MYIYTHETYDFGSFGGRTIGVTLDYVWIIDEKRNITQNKQRAQS